MSIRDYRLLEAATRLLEIAEIVRQDIGDCELCDDIKESASTLANLVRIKEWVK